MNVITQELIKQKDCANAAFQAKLTPSVSSDLFLGIRVPDLRMTEKHYRGTEEAKLFLNSLPHKYYDENLLHSVFISNMKDYEKAVAELEKFLPYVDNWAVCDTLKPKVFCKHHEDLIKKIREWIVSKETYTCRFGVDMLMTYFLDEQYKVEYLSLPARIHSKEYYVNMMIAWFYATALAKRWEDTVVFLENKVLDKWVHNKTITKACESFRISDERKVYLRTLKVEDNKK